MNIILLGPPGVGKGTQAKLICKRFFVEHISTGDILREQIKLATPLGLKVKSVLEAGELVSDDLIITLMVEELRKLKYKSTGFLLDGFPRNLSQARSLQGIGVEIDFIFYLKVADSIVVERIAGRRLELTRRDDGEKVIKNRLSVYHQITKPLIDWYLENNNNVIEIDASGKVEDIFSNIVKIITK